MGLIRRVILLVLILGVSGCDRPRASNGPRPNPKHVSPAPAPAASADAIAKRVAAGEEQGPVPRATLKTGRVMISFDASLGHGSYCGASVATDVLARAGYSVWPRIEVCAGTDLTAAIKRTELDGRKVALELSVFSLLSPSSIVSSTLVLEGITPSRHEIQVLLARVLTSAAFARLIDSLDEPSGERFVVATTSPDEIDSTCAREAKLGEFLLRP